MLIFIKEIPRCCINGPMLLLKAHDFLVSGNGDAWLLYEAVQRRSIQM